MNGKTAPKMIYICAPLKGNVQQNIARARAFCSTVINMGDIPVSAHTMLDGVLHDEIPAERETALSIGLEYVKRCDELWIFSKGISAGMQAEIDLAEICGIPVKNFFELDRRN